MVSNLDTNLCNSAQSWYSWELTKPCLKIDCYRYFAHLYIKYSALLRYILLFNQIQRAIAVYTPF